MLPPEVVAYYECEDERDRLTAPAGRLEWARTWVLLQRHLPDPKATIVDVGGGPGAYAIPLALAGHDIHLIDAMPLHVAQARQAAAAAGIALASTEVGDARELALAGRERRRRAAARPALPPARGGRAGTAPSPRHAGCCDRAASWPPLRSAGSPASSRGCGTAGPATTPGIVESGLHTGTHRNPGALPHRFTTAHFARPEELAAEVGAAGLGPVTLHAVEGPGALVDEPDEWMDDPARRDWLLRQLDRIETEPSLLGASPHVMAIAHR